MTLRRAPLRTATEIAGTFEDFFRFLETVTEAETDRWTIAEEAMVVKWVKELGEFLTVIRIVHDPDFGPGFEPE